MHNTAETLRTRSSLTVSLAIGERSISKLKLIKTYIVSQKTLSPI